jgi:hypothetical protein
VLETSLSSKSSWRNSFPLLTSCCSFFFIGLDKGTTCGCPSTKGYCNSSSSIGLDVRTGYGCSSTIGCCKSLFSIGLDVETNYNCSSIASWSLISIFFLESKTTITCGASFIVKVLVILRKFSVAFSSSNSLLLYSCSKTLIYFIIGAREPSGST